MLVEARTGGCWLTWTSDASEYEVNGLPAGAFRARALDLFGRATFATGATVREGLTAEPARLWTKVDLDEPDSRAVMGFVRWESGQPVDKATVVMQNSSNFRKYLRRAETDEQGFFRFLDVPGDEPYFVFAAPPGEENALREFQYFGVGSDQREVWRALEAHPHQIESEGVGAGPRRTFQLVRVTGGNERPIGSLRAGPSGMLAIGNVPHGHYRVVAVGADGAPSRRSLPFDVGDGRHVATVPWPSP